MRTNNLFLHLALVAALGGCGTTNKPIKMHTPKDWCSHQRGINGPVQSPQCGLISELGHNNTTNTADK